MSGLPVLLFFDVSGGELLLIILVVFLVFGPEKMPDIARKAGRLMNQMKKASNDLTREFKKETSSLQNEINSVHSKIKDQVESVNREFNSTKAQVEKDFNGDTKTVINSETKTNAEEPSVEKPDVTDPLSAEIDKPKIE
jgi:sec-independent protein translocase protein TatB